MSSHHSTAPGPACQPDVIYLVGSLPLTSAFLQCCPYAQSYVGDHVSRDWTVIKPLPCKRWGCSFCGRKNAYRLAARCERAKPNRLITLTVAADRWDNPRAAYEGTRAQVAEFAKRLRKSIKTFEYLRVLEATKRGWPHYHFAARCPYVPQREISRIWAEQTGAPIVDIRRIQNTDNVFRYILKYLCKQTHIPWTNRRISWSKNFFPPPEPYEKPPRVMLCPRLERQHPADLLSAKYKGCSFEVLKTGYILVHDIGG